MLVLLFALSLVLLQRNAAEVPLLHCLVFRLCFHLLCFRE